MIAVGDDDQNIYEFRGSSSEYMQQLVVNGARLFELLINYRSKKKYREPIPTILLAC